MTQMKKLDRLPTYNSGVVGIYRVKSGDTTSFGAKINVDSIDDLSLLVKLNFAEISRRQQDFEFAEQLGFSLSYKIKTKFHAKVDTKCKAIINGYLYDIQYIDPTQTELYIYLEGVKQLDP